VCHEIIPYRLVGCCLVCNRLQHASRPGADSQCLGTSAGAPPGRALCYPLHPRLAEIIKEDQLVLVGAVSSPVSIVSSTHYGRGIDILCLHCHMSVNLPLPSVTYKFADMMCLIGRAHHCFKEEGET
jgi:hypothetical protein